MKSDRIQKKLDQLSSLANEWHSADAVGDEKAKSAIERKASRIEKSIDKLQRLTPTGNSGGRANYGAH